MVIEREKFYRKMKKSPEENHTQTHGNLFDIFGDHRCLSESEMSKCMRKHGKDGVT